MTMRNPVMKVLFYAALVLIALVFVLPIVYMLLTAFKSDVEAQSAPPTFLPKQWTLEAYRTLFNDPGAPVLTWLMNSLVVASIYAVVSVLVCSLAGYAVARMKFRGRNFVFAFVISMMFIPGFVFLMPNFEFMSKLAWLDSYPALIVPGAASAFGLFFMRQFFLSLPFELEESARIDGAGPLRTFFSIVLPNARPALMTLLVLNFLANWNDFLWPLYVLFSENRLTLPVGLSRLQGSYTINYAVIMAGASVAAIPVLILFIFVQRYVIQGVAASGIKG
ncbi:carbohydrate ABC transporter permease [Propionibacteriaceae bacterium G1746]|uniref:carbohydrate ABC transporter permease n=1 Tax=Aestuariimicrobium sp. G57 TaxID=3418485 RepID=UPI003C278818